MKNLKKLMPIILVVAMLFSIYSLVSAKNGEKEEYLETLSLARKYSEEGLIKKSADAYDTALSMLESQEVRLEKAKMYLQNDAQDSAIREGEQVLKSYPYFQEAYEFLLEQYVQSGNASKFFKKWDEAADRGIRTEKLDELYIEIGYVFEYGFSDYADVSEYNDDNWAVLKKENWGFAGKNGGQSLDYKYKSAGDFVQSMAAIEDQDGKWYYIDKEGNKTDAPINGLVIEKLGIQNEGYIPIKVKGQYGYYSSDYEYKFGKYDFAGTYNYGLAAVKSGKSWSIINNKGDVVSKVNYSDVILDTKDLAFKSERAFVKINGRYLLINTSCKQVGKNEYEDADYFCATDQYAAVKIDGKWGFIDQNGEIVIEPQYENARSFSNNLAAVCKDGKWGFINKENKLCIDYQFEETKKFNDSGTTFVKVGGNWNSISLTRLNH